MRAAPGSSALIEVGVLVDRDHAAFAVEAVTPSGEFGCACRCLSQREVAPPVRSVDAAPCDPFAAQLRAGVVRVSAQ